MACCRASVRRRAADDSRGGGVSRMEGSKIAKPSGPTCDQHDHKPLEHVLTQRILGQRLRLYRSETMSSQDAALCWSLDRDSRGNRSSFAGMGLPVPPALDNPEKLTLRELAKVKEVALAGAAGHS
jgi:hypothetical protein